VAGQSSQDLFAQTVDGFAARVQQYADGIAGRLGSPLSGTQLSRDEVVQRWNFSPLGSTQAADAQYHALVAQGTAPGQALDQVYPMRSMLYQGSDLRSAIETARQIQGWVHDAAGTEPPPPLEGSTMPIMLATQRNAQMGAPPAAPPVGPALPPLLPQLPASPVAPAVSAPTLPPPPPATAPMQPPPVPPVS